MPIIVSTQKKSSKKWKILGIIFSLLIIVFILLRITDAFNFYSVPTPGNDPTIKVGSLVFATNQANPSNLDFIVFKPHLKEDNKSR